MFLKKVRTPKFFSLMAFAIVICAENANAGWQDYVEESTSVTVKTLPKTPKEERKSTIIDIFSQPKVSTFDLSHSDIQDEDLINIAYGLAQRSSKKSSCLPIKLLDISNEKISKNGVENLLIFFQKGVKVNEKNEIPDVRETILKVSSKVSVTDELLEKWYRIAPSVFSGGLSILE